MPGELLDSVIGPSPYPAYWLWLAAGLLGLVICWYVAVFTFTSRRWALGRRRYVRAVRIVGERHGAGELDLAAAAAAVGQQLRSFLYDATGVPAPYMQLEAIANSELSAFAAILTDLTDAQFNPISSVDVSATSKIVEEVIRKWS